MRNKVKSAEARTVSRGRSPFYSKCVGGRIAIISDSHDNVPNIEKALKYINKQGIKTIIHCGDLCSPTVLKRIIEPNFRGQIYLIHGNISDRERLADYAEKYDNVHLCGDKGEIKIDDKNIAFTHFPEEAKKLAKTGKYDLVFYGHTHRPWLCRTRIKTDHKTDKNRNNIRSNLFKNQFISVLRVNPGTLAGMFYKATFAIYDTKTDKLELIILERI